MILFIFFVIISLFFYRFIQVMNNDDKKTILQRNTPIKTLIFLGAGGHTSEMVSLLDKISVKNYTPRIYVIDDKNKTSEFRAKQREQNNKDYSIIKIPKSRDVGQSYLTSIFSTLKTFLFAIVLIFKEKPELILCNGPGTCVPIVVSSYISKFLGVTNSKSIFVESIARVESLSLTGKIFYHLRLVNQFVVQWPQMQNKFPRSVYLGSILC
eukprot:TRINITY_DN5892_c0_g1_i1.p1 TRINITY_DN5892_c0_g1~~TRINITY_DN5892_c0_g1_i1.p1  ORF type:complete len:211 (+),score=57.63 TRINITY_DN5892_c0_g1_i1:3-635(+)